MNRLEKQNPVHHHHLFQKLTDQDQSTNIIFAFEQPSKKYSRDKQ